MLSKSRVKYIQSLGHKKTRDEEGLFVAEGPKIVSELLKERNVHIKEIFALREWIDTIPSNEIQVPINEITAQELEKISQQSSPNQVLCIAEKINWNGMPDLNGVVTLMLDTIQDPGNMGTIIRIADWFGIPQICCSSATVDLYNPKVIQASMASIARVRVEYADLSYLLTANSGIRSYAATMDGRPVDKIGKLSEGIIVIGNEAKGISEEILKLCNVRVTIPGKGKADSLNAAVATGIILAHLT